MQFPNIESLIQFLSKHDKKILAKWRSLSDSAIKSLNSIRDDYEQLINICDPEKTKAHKWYKNHTPLPYHTSDSIYELAHHILPAVIEYEALLSYEYSYYKNKLSDSTRTKIKKILMQLHDDLKKDQLILASAMLSRLLIASNRNDIHFDDPPYYVSKNVRENTFKNITSTPKSPTRSLTIDKIYFFQQYIQQHGSLSQQQQLKQLAWIADDQHYSQVKYKENYLPVPKLFLSYEKPSFLDRILGIHHIKLNLLQRFNPLITQLRILPDPLRELEDLSLFSSNRRWNELKDINQQLHNTLSFPEKWLPTNFIFRLYPKAKEDLKNNWIRYFKNQQLEIFYSVINFIDKVNIELKSRLEIDDKAFCSPAFQKQLTQFLNDLVDIMKKSNIDPEEVPQFKEFNIHYHKIFELPAKLEKKKNEAEKAEKNNITSLDEFIDWSSKKMPTEMNQSKPVVLQNDLLNLISENGRFDHKESGFANKLNSILAYLESLPRNELNFISYEENHVTPFNLLKAYLLAWIESTEDQKAQIAHNLIGIEIILFKLAPLSIKESLNNLYETRNNKNWVTFQEKCHSLLLSLSNNLKLEESPTNQHSDTLHLENENKRLTIENKLLTETVSLLTNKNKELYLHHEMLMKKMSVLENKQEENIKLQSQLQERTQKQSSYLTNNDHASHKVVTKFFNPKCSSLGA